MKYFLDTEFVISRDGKGFQLLSIAILREDGVNLYLINADYPNMIGIDEFVDECVIPNLDVTEEKLKTTDEMANLIIDFFGDDDDVVIYGDYYAHDYVLFAGLFGNFDRYPNNLPMYFRDINFLRILLGVPEQTYSGLENRHNALNDVSIMKMRYDIFKKEAGCGVLENY